MPAKSDQAKQRRVERQRQRREWFRLTAWAENNPREAAALKALLESPPRPSARGERDREEYVELTAEDIVDGSWREKARRSEHEE